MEHAMTQMQRRVLYFLGALFLFSMTGLNQWGVIDTSEARYAHIAKNMYETNDYVHPVYLGVEHYHKPPLTYQMTGLVYEVLGPSPFSARFLLQLALLAQCLFIFLTGREILSDPRSAFHAVCIYLSFAIVWVSVRNLTTDAYLNTWILASVWTLTYFAKHDRQKYLYLLALFGGLGFLTKISAYFVIAGPVALAILWHYRGKYRWTWHIAGAVLLFVAVVASWFVALGAEGWAIFKYLLYEQSLVRYTSDVFFRNQPWWYYAALVPALSLPWIVAGVGFTLKKRNLRSLAGLLLLVGFVFPIVFYSLSKSKLILYVLPCFPFLALFCAEHLQRIRPGLLRAIKVTGLGLGALLLAGMPAYAFSVWEISAVLAIVCMLSILALLAVWFATDVESGSVAVPAASMILVAGAVCWLIGANEEEVPTTDVVTDWMEQNDLAGRQILIYDKLMPSAAFHSEAPVALIADESENALRELQFEEDESWKEHYFNMNEPAGEARLMEEIASTPSVVVVRRKHAYEAGAGPAFLQHFPHAEDVGEYWVYY